MTKPLIATIALLGLAACSTFQSTGAGTSQVRADRSDAGTKPPLASNAAASASNNSSSSGMYYSDNRTTHRTGLSSDPKDPNGTGVEGPN